VNGGFRISPRLLYADKPSGNERAEMVRAPILNQVPVTDPGNWVTIKEGMRRVIHGADGSARGIEPLTGYQIAGKSGTAQVYAQAQGEDVNRAEGPVHLRNHALFIAYAPFVRPRIVVAAVVEHGGGGSSEAAPVARAVLDSWLRQEVDQ